MLEKTSVTVYNNLLFLDVESKKWRIFISWNRKEKL